MAREGFSPDGTKTIGCQSETWEMTGNHEWELSMKGRDSRKAKSIRKVKLLLES